jgi:hypothetical protein
MELSGGNAGLVSLAGPARAIREAPQETVLSNANLVESPVAQSPHDVNRTSNMLADMHLSAGDPRMFPGILTRGQRTNSLRNLAQVDDGTTAPKDAAKDK